MRSHGLQRGVTDETLFKVRTDIDDLLTCPKGRRYERPPRLFHRIRIATIFPFCGTQIIRSA